MDVVTSARRQKHVSRACNSCRKRRTKCDGRPTCQACAEIGDICVYEAGQDGRKPRTKHYIAALEDRVEALKAQLERYEQIGSGIEKGAGDIPLGVTHPSLLSLKGGLRVYKHGLWHNGPTSLLMHEPDQPSRILNPPPTSKSLLLRTMDWSTVAWDACLPPGLLSENLHKELLSVYFSYLNDWCHWSDEGEFLSGLTTYGSASGSSYYSAMFHNIILALACHVSCGPEEVAQGLARHAADLLETEGQQPLPGTAKAILLLGTWQWAKQRYALGWGYVGMSVRTAQILGLHVNCQDLVQRGIMSTQMKNHRDRTFGTIFCQEQMWSLTQGHPTGLISDYIDAPLPVIDEELDAKPWLDHVARLSGGIGSPSWTSTNFHHTCKLIRIAERVNVCMYLRSDVNEADRRQKCSELRLELQTWLMDLPPKLHRSASSQLPPHIINLHLVFHHILILLMRPTITRPLTWDDPEREAAKKTCSDAAVEITTLLRLLRSTPGYCMASLAIGQAASSAGTVFLLDAVQATECSAARRNALELFDQCVSALNDSPWPMSQQVSGILNNMREDWCFPTPPTTNRAKRRRKESLSNPTPEPVQQGPMGNPSGVEDWLSMFPGSDAGFWSSFFPTFVEENQIF